MKRKKIVSTLMALLLCAALTACGQQSVATNDNVQESTVQEEVAESQKATEEAASVEESVAEESVEVVEEGLTEKIYSPSEANVKVLGRADFYNDTLWMVHSGSGAEFTFTGTKAVITMQSDSTIMGSRDSQARVAVYVNGECVVDDMVDQMAEIYTVFESEAEEECTIKVIKLTEATQSTVGIKEIKVTSNGEIQPAENKERLIEFIGDSITCGYGVEDEDRNHHFSTKTENIMKTYAYKTAEALDADYSMVSFSGYGIVSGYSGNGERQAEQLVPLYYDKLGFSYNAYIGQYPADFEWDFSKRQPDVIVVNLGTNDESYTKTDAARREEYVNGYVEFLKQIRENNPDATILCTLGVMGDALYTSVEGAVANYQSETGDANVYSMKFAVQSSADGYAADWHPTEATHTKAAEKLTTEIKEIMGW